MTPRGFGFWGPVEPRRDKLGLTKRERNATMIDSTDRHDH